MRPQVFHCLNAHLARLQSQALSCRRQAPQRVHGLRQRHGFWNAKTCVRSSCVGRFICCFKSFNRTHKARGHHQQLLSPTTRPSIRNLYKFVFNVLTREAKNMATVQDKQDLFRRLLVIVW